ncbi:glycosyltransferase [filamentous cyanobacterium LEGE 11480]|uniref:Glycosyltransferase n=1 Tax=Romeriopsis navalis LEGE 11480 TaxID=2777977 RepID=A0A928Z4X9_9CYAN|nr:glycosyltransferase family 2 protein [Romeriopsis navalis]MBE9030665.1 glycosyltransferase [Romeriopsis navalis LEGE 11480]
MYFVLLKSITLLLTGLSGFLLLLCLLLLLETIAFLLPPRAVQHQSLGPQPRAAIVIPAHDEEAVLAETLAPLTQLPYPIVLVADNCSDRTATIGRNFGALVIERHNPYLLGKGYAMDFGIDFLSKTPPDVVLFLDADCQVPNAEVMQLIDYAIQFQRPIQSAYVMRLPSEPTSKHRVSVFAFKFKNQVRMHGLSRLGGPTVLAGSGMAFPWHTLENVNLASGAIVEDMKLGIDLAISSRPVLFYPHATVTSVLPQKTTAVNSQRTRWEHGHLQSIGTYVPKLLVASLRQRRGDLLLLAWDLCIPPLSLMVMLWAMSLGVITLAYSFGMAELAFNLILMAGVMLLSAILLAWQRIGRTDLPLRDLLRIPFYVLGKVPLYLRFMTDRQEAWERTERDRVESSSSISLSSKN